MSIGKKGEPISSPFLLFRKIRDVNFFVLFKVNGMIFFLIYHLRTKIINIVLGGSKCIIRFTGCCRFFAVEKCFTNVNISISPLYPIVICIAVIMNTSNDCDHITFAEILVNKFSFFAQAVQ